MSRLCGKYDVRFLCTNCKLEIAAQLEEEQRNEDWLPLILFMARWRHEEIAWITWLAVSNRERVYPEVNN